MILEVILPVPLHKTFDYRIPETISPHDYDALVGHQVRVPFGPRSAVGVVRAIKTTSDFPLAKIKFATQLVEDGPMLDSALCALAEWMSTRFVCSLGDAYFSLLPDSPSAPPPAGPHIETTTVFEGNASTEQKEALDILHEAVYGGASKSFLLTGRSWSDRWQVYMSAVKDILPQGKSAILMTPEIETARRAARLLQEKFGEKAVCLWHSDLKPKERWIEWWRIKRMEAPIVVGTRLAALAPAPNVGLVVVDEEESGAYKEERRPRWHARTLALQRAQFSSAVAVLGSASPSIESSFEAIERRHHLIVLKEKSTSGTDVRIVDMEKEGKKGLLSPALLDGVSDRLKKGQKSILFLNRKGFHRYLRCKNCGWTGEYKLPAPTLCPECGQKKVKAAGYGTERIVEYVREKMPWAKVERWDSDVRKKGRVDAPPSDFDMLVGTELVTHGFHFPGVSLVGLVDADVPLRIPDFRASERTFQLLNRIADQTDHHLVGAEMIIQTRNTDHYVFDYFKNRDHAGFVAAELKYREELNYPPFSQLIVLRPEEKNEAKAEKQIDEFMKWIDSQNSDGSIGVLGPNPKRQVILKVPREKQHEFLNRLKNFVSQTPARFWLDIDPETIS